jgi:ribonuclease T2
MLVRTVRTTALAVATLAVVAVAAATGALAQRDTSQDRWSQPGRYGDHRAPQGKNQAGQFDYYSLVLSWSPTYCATPDRASPDPQCERRDGRRYAFVLHGLWPQYERGYPEYCPVRGRPFVPQPIIDGMLDIMPSPRLAIHEYKKHGTCSGLDPAGYFTLSRKLFGAIKIPERYVNPFENQMVAPDEVVQDFVKANPGLKPDMMAISCGGAGNRLREIRFCFAKDGNQPRSCGRNEDQRRLCSAQKMFLPPVRSMKQGPEPKPSGSNAPGAGSPLPAPRLPPSQRSL